MIKDTDNGYKKLFEAVFADENPIISVGVHSNEGKEKHNGETDASLTVADVAAFHEYGLGNNPRRSFIGDWFDQNQQQIMQMATKGMQQALKGSLTKQQLLARLGAMMVGGIQARMSGGIPPALTSATIARKGSSVPLIDTGQLRSSITWVIK